MKWIVRIILFGAVLACSSEGSDLKELSLLDKGFPITILAPDSAEVKVSNMAFMKDITIIDDDTYNIQILVSKATSSSGTGLLAQIKEQAQSNPYFSEMILEEKDGFIFKNIIDSLASYDFRYVRIKAGKEYIFQTGLSSNFNEGEVQRMYDAVKYQDKEK